MKVPKSSLRLSRIAVLFSLAFFGLTALSPPLARAETQGEAIVAVAASQEGVPYCFDGGNQFGPTACGGMPATFDCTGLTMYAVYQETGKVLSHDGRQGTEGGQRIYNESELQPGDLVFFGGTFDNFEHAGVYAGGGKIWDALNYGIPVQEHTFAQVGLPFVGGARYWSGGGSPTIHEGDFVSLRGNAERLPDRRRRADLREQLVACRRIAPRHDDQRGAVRRAPIAAEGWDLHPADDGQPDGLRRRRRRPVGGQQLVPRRRLGRQDRRRDRRDSRGKRR